MSLWRLTRNEVAGAWRSLQYDLGRRADPGGWQAIPAPQLPPSGRPALDDVTRPRWYPGHHRFDRPPRRLIAVSVFGALALSGGAGSYVAVVEGLDSLFSESAGPDPYPLLADAAPSRSGAREITPRDHDTSSPHDPHRRTSTTATPTDATVVRVPGPVAPDREPVRLVPAARTVPPSQSPQPEPTCDCLNPPVPTPTSPPSASPSPSPSPSPWPSPSSSDPSPSPSPSDSDDVDSHSDDSTAESDEPTDPAIPDDALDDRWDDPSGDSSVPSGPGRHRKA